MNPFNHINTSFQGILGKYIGPQTNESQGKNPMLANIAVQGGLSVGQGTTFQSHQLQPAFSQPGRIPPEITRNLPGMQTTAQSPHQTTSGTNQLQSNPFLSYLSKIFGPNAQKTSQAGVSPYLRQLPIEGQRSPSLLSNTPNVQNTAIPNQNTIPASVLPVNSISNDVLSGNGTGK